MGTDAALVMCFGVKVDELFSYKEVDRNVPFFSSKTGERLKDCTVSNHIWVSNFNPDIQLTDYELCLFFENLNMSCTTNASTDSEFFKDDSAVSTSWHSVMLDDVFGYILQEGEMERAYRIEPIEIVSHEAAIYVLSQKVKDKLFGVTPHLMVTVKYSY